MPSEMTGVPKMSGLPPVWYGKDMGGEKKGRRKRKGTKRDEERGRGEEEERGETGKKRVLPLVSISLNTRSPKERM